MARFVPVLVACLVFLSLCKVGVVSTDDGVGGDCTPLKLGGTWSASTMFASKVAVALPSVASHCANMSVIIHGGTTQLQSHEVNVGVFANKAWYTCGQGGKLALQSAMSCKGSSAVRGAFESLELHWVSPSTQAVQVTTTCEVYSDQPVVVFTQSFPVALTNTNQVAMDEVSSVFPAFDVPTGVANANNDLGSLGYLTWTGMWNPGTSGTGLVNYTGGINGGPLILFDRTSLASFVFSTFSSFKVGVLKRPSTLSSSPLVAGLNSMVKSIPANFSFSSMLYIGNPDEGITATAKGWGATLLQEGGKSPTPPDADIVTSTLGYYTDNGAYYYDRTLDNTTYFDTLRSLRAHFSATSSRIPVRYFQLDSWWYEWGPDHGVSAWVPRKDNMTFPSGSLPDLGLPLQLHNRFWSQDNTYSNINFVRSSTGGVSHGEAFPTDTPADNQYRLFHEIMSKAKGFGLAVYEQDWMNPQFTGVNATRYDVHSAENWLLQMGQAASDVNVTILYCMSLPSDYLQSTAIPAVKSIRVSDDYYTYLRERKPTWNIATTSLLAWAVGLRPTKDVFWSNVTNPGYWHSTFNHNTSEPNPVLVTLSALLSSGQVAFGDCLGCEDRTLLLRSCRSDGVLLAPSRPALPIDRTFAVSSMAPQPQTSLHMYGAVVSTTESLIPFVSPTGDSTMSWHFVLSSNLSAPFSLEAKDVYSEASGTPQQWMSAHIIADAELLTPVEVSLSLAAFPSLQLPQSSKLPAPLIPFNLHMIAPVVNGWVILGELEKLVPISARRVLSVSTSAADVTVALQGTPGEMVQFTVVDVASSRSAHTGTTAKCKMDASGHASLVLSADGHVAC